MTKSQKALTVQGGCHCGSVRFQVLIDRWRAEDCNCSICRKKGFLHLIIPPENFQLLQGANSLTSYSFNTKIAQHTFCSVCGIHAFYRPRSHPNMIDVNLHCLDRDITDKFTIRPFDGQNWSDNVAQIRD